MSNHYHDNCPVCHGKGDPDTRPVLAKVMGLKLHRGWEIMPDGDNSEWVNYYAFADGDSIPVDEWHPDLDANQMAMVERAVNNSEMHDDPETWERYISNLLTRLEIDEDRISNVDAFVLLTAPTCIRARAMAKAIGG